MAPSLACHPPCGTAAARTTHAVYVTPAAAPLPRAGFRSDRPRQATRCICPAARGLSTAVRRSCDQAPSRHPAGRAARSAPARTCRSVPWNRWRGRVRRCPNPGLPLRRNAHFPAIGQASHNGDFAVHTVAPSSMTAWFHTTDGRSKRRHFAESSSGSSRFASARSAGLALPPSDSTPTNARDSTRRMFVSTTAIRSPKANDSTALAV